MTSSHAVPSSTLLFDTPSYGFEAGYQPGFLQLIDVDADGFLDAVLCNGGGLGTDPRIVTPPLWFPAGESIAVLRGNGQGGFDPPLFSPTASRPVHFASGDFDADGDVDLAVACRDDSTLSVLLGAGDAGFPARRDIAVPGIPTWLDAGDIDRDGRQDLAVTLDRKSIAILRGTGDGGFVLASEVVQDRLAAAALGDLDRDGDLDLAIASATAGGRVHWRWGNGDGSFGTSEAYSTPLGVLPTTIALADFDNDGWLDVATVNKGINVFVLLKRFERFVVKSLDAEYALWPRVVDVDRDGKLDLLVSDWWGDASRLFFGRGNGDFDPGGNLPHIGTFADARDVDGDGLDDLVGVRTWDHDDATGQLQVTRGVGQRAFGAPEAAFGTAEGPVDIVAADVNGDADLDLAVAGAQGEVVAVHLGNGHGWFGGGIDTRPAGWGPLRLAIARLDADAHPDLVVANRWDNLSIHAGVGDGTFVTANTLPSGLEELHLADLNADGVLDIFSGHAYVYLGKGGLAFQAIAQPLATHIVLGRLSESHVGDVNSDGILDLVGLVPAEARAVSLFGIGDGTFTPGATFAVSAGAVCGQLADLDGDGRLDLGVCARSAAGATLGVWRGNGDGTFVAGGSWTLDARPEILRFADLDVDSDLDAVVGESPAVISVLLGRGDATFEPRTSYQVTASGFGLLEGIVVGDWNGDDTPDLAVAFGESSRVVIVRGEARAPTPIVASLDVVRHGGAVVVRVEIGVADVADLVRVGIERGATQAGPFVLVQSVEPSPRIEFRDETAAAAPLWYRAVLHSARGSVNWVGPVQGPAIGVPTALAPVVDQADREAIGIDYTLHARASVDLSIVDVRGRVVVSLDRGLRAGGPHRVMWERSDGRGRRVARGIYFVVLRAAGETHVQRVLLLRS